MKSLYIPKHKVELFDKIKSYCLFVGHARSGHSIIGALLDAHPNAIISDEADTLKYVSTGFSRDQIYSILLAKSKKQVRKKREKKGRDVKQYSYMVPGQWQGTFDNLNVIGDTKAGISTRRLAKNYLLLDRLKNIIGNADLKIIHVVRNPYDNISTFMIRGGKTFDEAIERYFENCEIMMNLRKRINGIKLHMVKHEDIIEQPKVCLEGMCRFLGLPTTSEYLNSCSNIIYNNPAKSRYKIKWTRERVDRVQKNIDTYEFLKGYSYET
jgi:hypothetical protein